MGIMLKIQQFACYAVIKVALTLAKFGNTRLLHGVLDSLEKAKANLTGETDKKATEDIIAAVKQEAAALGVDLKGYHHA